MNIPKFKHLKAVTMTIDSKNQNQPETFESATSDQLLRRRSMKHWTSYHLLTLICQLRVPRPWCVLVLLLKKKKKQTNKGKMVKHSRNAKKTKPSKTVPPPQHFIDASSSVWYLTQDTLPFVRKEDITGFILFWAFQNPRLFPVFHDLTFRCHFRKLSKSTLFSGIFLR